MRRAGRAVVGVLASVLMVAGGIAIGAPAAGAPDASGASASAAAALAGPVEPTGPGVDLATGLVVPWSILQLKDANNTVLISERNTGVIMRVTPTGLDPLATVPGVYYDGHEGGLLGLATLVDGPTRWIYAYLTTTTDNRIVRMVYTDPGDPAEATLGAPQVILSGIGKAGNHNGGRIAFGPDGLLYATVGDKGDRSLPQNKNSLNGKILRMTPTGGVPAGNPFGTLVYSYGHRNPQGLAWDDDGQLWSAELGQDTWDEFNRIVPGGNYGWPIVEGKSSDKRFINPWAQWHTDDSSPSGLTYVDGTFFMAALRGSRVWTIYVDEEAGTARSTSTFVNTYGRIRDVAPGPAGKLWILTNNTARGIPREGDDRLVEVPLIDSGTVDGTITCATCLRADVSFGVTLQRNTSSGWTDYAKTTVEGGPSTTGDYAFPAVFAGTYRVVVKDTGADGYLTFTGTSFSLTKGGTRHEEPIALRGSQLDRDLSGDGLNDLLAVSSGGDLVAYDGATGGGFDAARTVAAGWSADAVATAQVGDFDGDGFADVVSRDAAGALWLHPGDGSGGLATAIQIASADAGQTALVGPGDWDADGKPDLITQDGAGVLWLRGGNGQDPLDAPTRIAGGFRTVKIFAVGDLNGDRLPDLAARTSTGSILLYPGNSSGGFKPRFTIATASKTYTAHLGTGDVSGDGRPDIVTRAADGALRLFRGTGTTIKSPPTVISGDWTGVTFAS